MIGRITNERESPMKQLLVLSLFFLMAPLRAENPEPPALPKAVTFSVSVRAYQAADPSEDVFNLSLPEWEIPVEAYPNLNGWLAKRILDVPK